MNPAIAMPEAPRKGRGRLQLLLILAIAIGPMFLASIRQSIYQRSLPLSTRHLEILYAPLGNRAGVIGCAAMALREILRLRGSESGVRA